MGGAIVFGGGLPFYDASDEMAGGLGLSAGTACVDHAMAWKVRHILARPIGQTLPCVAWLSLLMPKRADFATRGSAHSHFSRISNALPVSFFGV